MKTRQPDVRDNGEEILVLFIEDEPDMIAVVRLVLERSGLRVVEALDGDQGLELARRLNPDVVLLDLMMPGMTGWEVNGHMKADRQLRDIPVVVLTAMEQIRKDPRDLPVDDYVMKPFAPSDLVHRIRQAARVARQRSYTPAADQGEIIEGDPPSVD